MENETLNKAQADYDKACADYDKKTHLPTQRMSTAQKVKHLNECTRLLQDKRQKRQQLVALRAGKGD